MQQTEDEVLAIVRPYVEHSEVEGITFALDNYFERTPYSFKIGVRPSRYPRHMYILYDELAELATDIAEKEKLNVFFVVGFPQEIEEEDEAELAHVA